MALVTLSTTLKPTSSKALYASALVLNEANLPVIQIVFPFEDTTGLLLTLKENGKNSFISKKSVSNQPSRLLVTFSPKPASLHFSGEISSTQDTTLHSLVDAVLPNNGILNNIYSDKLIVKEYTENVYCNGAWNYGAENCKNYYYALCNDDILFDTRIIDDIIHFYKTKDDFDRIKKELLALHFFLCNSLLLKIREKFILILLLINIFLSKIS